MMRGALTVLCLFLLGACGGCVPHYDRYAPVIEGSVLRAGQPVSGATVKLAVGTMTSSTQTDTAGKFKVGPLEQLGIMLYGDTASGYVTYTLTIQQDGVTYIGLSESASATGDLARVECDLSAPPRKVRYEDWYCVMPYIDPLTARPKAREKN